MRMLRTTQSLPRETCLVERFLSINGQGVLDYGTPTGFEANIVMYDTGPQSGMADDHAIGPDGIAHPVAATLYVRGDETEVPQAQDRVTLSSEDRTFIVIRRKDVHGLWFTSGEADHYVLYLRLEGA